MSHLKKAYKREGGWSQAAHDLPSYALELYFNSTSANRWRLKVRRFLASFALLLIFIMSGKLKLNTTRQPVGLEISADVASYVLPSLVDIHDSNAPT